MSIKIESARLAVFPDKPGDHTNINARIFLQFSDETSAKEFVTFYDEKLGELSRDILHSADEAKSKYLVLEVIQKNGVAKVDQHKLDKLLEMLSQNTNFDFKANMTGRYASFRYENATPEFSVKEVLPRALFWAGAAASFLYSFTALGAFLLASSGAYTFRMMLKRKSLNELEAKTENFVVSENEQKGMLCGLEATDNLSVQLLSVFDRCAYNKEFLSGYYGAMAAKQHDNNPELVAKIQSLKPTIS